MDVDQIQLQFSPASLTLLNGVIGLVMFGVALDMRLDDFRRVLRNRRAALVGLSAQFVLLPALTFALICLLRPHPSMALGMILVAACPGGTMSNFLTHWGRGDAALSVSLSAISTLVAGVMTPLNLTFWGGLYPPTAKILRQVALSPLDLLLTLCTILVLPIIVGMTLAHHRPQWAARARQPMRIFSLFCLAAFVIIALAANFGDFLRFGFVVSVLVFVHNSLALAGGYLAAKLVRLDEASRRALTFEVGIQNTALGLILIFDFFAGLGGMALVAAWWGVWHLISGFSLATFWRRRPPGAESVAESIEQAVP